ncbi:extracellular solute-binding protein [Nocardia sp. NBC_00511]|uniref:extracellular solute-binding protein n=1 Tax=Nocardia sp. NBC_00511 TaxID=2903591 RepID=UPI0030E2EB3F
MSLSRRAFAAAALASTLVLAGCGKADDATPAAAPTSTWTAPAGLSGELTLYSANPQELTDDLVAAFTKASGVKVNVFGGETGKITAKLDAEWQNPQADVVYLASWTPVAKYAADGRTLAYKPQDSDKIQTGWAGKDDAYTGRDGSALTIVVNTKVSPGSPKDWADLAAPEYKGKVIMPDPRESGTARDLVAAMVAAWGKDKTWELFDKLFANGMAVHGANGPALDDVTAGSHAVVLGGVDYSAYAAVDKGEPLQVVAPASGTTITPRPVFIVKSTKNPTAAKALEDFMFSPQAQQISASRKMIPGRTDVAAAPGTRPYGDIKQLTFTWDQVQANGKSVLDEFTKRYLG